MTSTVQTPAIDWTALTVEALDDIRANLPLPPSAPMTEADVKALLAAMQADLPAVAAMVKAHPGVITAVGRFLTALAAVRLPNGEQRYPWAGTLKAALDGLPGGLATAEEFMPFISGMIDEFSPAPGKFLGIA
jgi:hypothetical protein